MLQSLLVKVCNWTFWEFCCSSCSLALLDAPLPTYSRSHPRPMTPLTFNLQPLSREAAQCETWASSWLCSVTWAEPPSWAGWWMGIVVCSEKSAMLWLQGPESHVGTCVHAPGAQKGGLNTMAPFIDFSLYLRHDSNVLNWKPQVFSLPPPQYQQIAYDIEVKQKLCLFLPSYCSKSCCHVAIGTAAITNITPSWHQSSSNSQVFILGPVLLSLIQSGVSNSSTTCNFWWKKRNLSFILGSGEFYQRGLIVKTHTFVNSQTLRQSWTTYCEGLRLWWYKLLSLLTFERQWREN